MSELRLEDWLPAGAPVRIKGVLLSEYVGSDIALLDQDILEIELPANLRIDVGWFPENDPAGHFMVRVFRNGELAPIHTAAEVTSPLAVAALIGDLVRQYLSRSASVA